MYQKEIIYMSLFRDEVRESCVGYLKLEKKQEKYRAELQVKNVPSHVAGSFPIRLQDESGWREEGMLAVNDGSGYWTGDTEAEVIGAEIILQDSYRIKGQSKRAARERKTEETAREGKTEENGIAADGMANLNQQAQRSVPEQDSESKTTENNLQGRQNQYSVQESESKSADNALQSQQLMPKPTAVYQKQRSMPEPSVRHSEPKCQAVQPKPFRREAKVNLQKKSFQAESAESQKRQKNVPLYENKWEQLLTAYEQIHPYGDDRVYVKLEPKDFIVLRSNYQHLVNNSFLLHGFYNYRYLILGKEKEYYLGVPGVFYEREKMVALMFGFEAFECEGGEVEEGKFGYYLRKVEL